MANDTLSAPDVRHALFFEQLALCGSPSIAAKAAGYFNASSLYKKRIAEEEFAERWQTALDEFASVLEAEAFRRAVRGTAKPVVYQGQMTYLYVRGPDGRVVYDMVDEGETDKEGSPVLTRVPRPQLDDDGQPKVVALQEYSDSLLALMLKARVPGYKDRVEVANAPGEVFKTEETPLQIARQVAFALALGMQNVEKQQASGEDLA